MPAAAHTSPGGTRHARHLQLVIAHLALTLACVSASVSYGAQNSAVPATQELRVGTLTGTMDACRARGSFPREHLYLSSLATRLERQLVWVCFTNKDALRQAVAAGLVDLAAAFLSPMSKSAGSQDDITFARPVANARSVVYAPPGPRIAAARHAYQRSFQHNSDQSKAADTVVYPHDTRARVLLGDLLARSVDQVHLSNDELDEATPLKQAQDRGLAAHLGPRAQSRRWALPGERNKLEDAVDQFLQDPAFAGLNINGSGLGVQSMFFQVSVKARYLDRFAYLTSVVQRDPADGSMRVIYRDLSRKITPTVTSQAEDG